MILRVKYQTVFFNIFLLQVSKLHFLCSAKNCQKLIPCGANAIPWVTNTIACVTNMDNYDVKYSSFMLEKPYVPNFRFICT